MDSWGRGEREGDMPKQKRRVREQKREEERSGERGREQGRERVRKREQESTLSLQQLTEASLSLYSNHSAVKKCSPPLQPLSSFSLPIAPHLLLPPHCCFSLLPSLPLLFCISLSYLPPYTYAPSLTLHIADVGNTFPAVHKQSKLSRLSQAWVYLYEHSCDSLYSKKLKHITNQCLNNVNAQETLLWRQAIVSWQQMWWLNQAIIEPRQPILLIASPPYAY